MIRWIALGAVVSSCGHSEPAAATSPTPQSPTAGSASDTSSGPAPAPAPVPLILLDGREPVVSQARRALEHAGMRAQIANDIEDAMRGGLFFGDIESAPPKAVPAATAEAWRKAATSCQPARAKCGELRSANPACEELLKCAQGLEPALREAWIRELGAAAWIHVIAGPTERHDNRPSTQFFAKAWGHRVCEPTLRELRVGAESDIMTVGSAAAVPATSAEADATAAALAVRIANGEGERTERSLPPWVALPKDPAGVLALLGCPH